MLRGGLTLGVRSVQKRGAPGFGVHPKSQALFVWTFQISGRTFALFLCLRMMEENRSGKM